MSDRKAVEGAIDYAIAQGGAEPVSRLGAAGWIQGVLYDWINGRLESGSSLGSRGWIINKFIEAGAGASFNLPLNDLGNGEANLVPLAGTGSATFTRSTIATTIGSTGLIIPVSSGVARSYYDPTTLQYMGYLAEGARTNLLLRSSEFDNASWTKTDTTVTANATISPDGTQNADLLTEGVAGTALVSQSATIIADSNSCVSRFLKRGNTDWVRLSLQNASGTSQVNGWFNLASGQAGTLSTVGVASAISSSIEACSNGFYRCSINGSIGGAATSTVVYSLSASANGVGTRVNNATRYEWGAQFENNATFPSTYIPTAGSSVTRNIDVDSYPTAGNVSSAAGTIALTFTPNHAPSGTIFLWGTYVDASNYTALLHDGTNLIMRKRISGVNYDATKALAFVSGTAYKVGGTWGASGVTVAVSGVMGTPSADTTATQIGSTMQVGADGNGAGQPFSSERDVRIWQQQFTAAQLQAITA